MDKLQLKINRNLKSILNLILNGTQPWILCTHTISQSITILKLPDSSRFSMSSLVVGTKLMSPAIQHVDLKQKQAKQVSP